jgi:hypothetical protein
MGKGLELFKQEVADLDNDTIRLRAVGNYVLGNVDRLDALAEEARSRGAMELATHIEALATKRRQNGN